MTEQTLGQYRTMSTLDDPAGTLAGDLRAMGADLIDKIDGIPCYDTWPEDRQAEVGRSKARAMSAVEDAVMHAIRAATKPPRILDLEKEARDRADRQAESARLLAAARGMTPPSSEA
ncbi:MAG: hypothetical protein AB8B85_04120 [Paracoccaceae bacterium]